jgi:hypothetical protein
MLFEAFCVGAVPDKDAPLHDLYEGLSLQAENLEHEQICICLKGPTYRVATGSGKTKEWDIENEQNVARTLKNTENLVYLEYTFDSDKEAWEVADKFGTTLEQVIEIVSNQLLSRPPLKRPRKAVLAGFI